MLERQQVAGLIHLLLPKKLAAKYSRSDRAIDDLRFHLQLAADIYRAASDESPLATKKETQQAISAVKRLRTTLTNPGMAERVEHFNEQATLLPYDMQLQRLEKILVAARASLPKSAPNRALRCAIAPLMALFREHTQVRHFGTVVLATAEQLGSLLRRYAK